MKSRNTPGLTSALQWLYQRLQLAKFLLCLLIAGSTLFGYLLESPILSLQMVIVGCGMLLLATGAATLNSLQECELDGRMARTRQRPLPLGEITRKQAAVQGFTLLAAGLAVTYKATDTFFPVLLGGGAVILYNAIYTPLKPKTILAIVPGALCGALPPAIGWLAAGGEPFSYPAILLVTLFILWQVPHFCLVMLSFQDDYEKGTLPSLLTQFGARGLQRMLIPWIGAMVVVMLLFTTLNLAPLFRIAICLNSASLLLVMAHGGWVRKPPSYRMLFVRFNIFFLLHMVIVAFGRLLL